MKKLTNFDIYENRATLVIVSNTHTLCIDRASRDMAQMTTESTAAYDTAGMKLVVSNVCALLGLVRFTKGCYIPLVLRHRPVALLGGHHIYHVEDTRLLSISYKPERSEQEDKAIATFKTIDLSKNFYYSLTYDLTLTLQANHQGKPSEQMFVWNHQLLRNTHWPSRWTVPLIHGYVDQSRLSIYGHDIYITLIARRSRHMAGVRYLKRGVNPEGYVANDVETEQIASQMEQTFFRPSAYTSYVQHRGSIPLNWSQESSGITPKPPIEINVHDPYFVQASKHFRNLIERYGAPAIVLNLIKTKERHRREVLLGEEFSEAIRYLNQFRDQEIRYLAWDMSRAKRNRQEDVLAILEVIAEESLALTGIFHNGPELYSNYLKQPTGQPRRRHQQTQRGVVRSNCIDCLDRTNAAQTIVGKVALAHQLYALGQISHPQLSFDTDASVIIEEMYHDLGNTLALQYGGSHLVNTVQTYRRNTNWRSHSRDIVESLRRYYSNSLLDMERQEAITYFVEKSLLPEASDSLKEDTGTADPWEMYYRTSEYTQLGSLFLGSLNSSASLHPHCDIQNMPSPFLANQTSAPRRRQDPDPQWLHSEAAQSSVPTRHQIYQQLQERTPQPPTLLPLTMGGWSSDGIQAPLQQPQVTETQEYQHYIDQLNDSQYWIVEPSHQPYQKPSNLTADLADALDTHELLPRRSQTPIIHQPSTTPHRVRSNTTSSQQSSRQRRGSLWNVWPNPVVLPTKRDKMPEPVEVPEPRVAEVDLKIYQKVSLENRVFGQFQDEDRKKSQS